MSNLQFLAEWGVRSAILIGSGGLLMQMLRVKDAAIRGALWTALLFGSLAMPALTVALPRMFVPTFPPVEPVVFVSPTLVHSDAVPLEPAEALIGHNTQVAQSEAPVTKPFDWERAVWVVYAFICGALLLRVCGGLWMGMRLMQRSRATGQVRDGVEIRESARIASPLTLRVLRPVIVLPDDWHNWDSRTLEAVLAHERSHIRRYDPAVQVISAIHRALLWFSPLSWYLHQRIVRTAEDLSDDAAVAATGDRAFYAETLLHFMQRGVWNAGWAGVPMARYGSPEKRIRRILNSTALSRGLTIRSVAAIVALASPLAYVVATAQPQSVAQLRLPFPPAPGAPAPQAFQVNRSAVSEPTFITADLRSSAPNTILKLRASFTQGRYELRNATAVELIQTAWNVDGDNIVGGPEWIDKDRFDVIATAPADATPDSLRARLRILLQDRFQLKIRPDTRSILAYAMTTGKNPQLKKSETSSGQESGCSIRAGGLLEPVVIQCRNMTMAAFAEDLPTHWPAPDYLLNYRIVDRTGLKGAWDFTFQCSRPPNGQPVQDVAITLLEAFEKQLGLNLRLAKVPTQVMVVENIAKPVTQTQTARPLAFEVATIKPDGPNARGSNVAVQPDGRVRITMTLQDLIWEAWGNLNTDRIVDGPTSMSATHWVIEAKAPAQEITRAGKNGAEWNGPNWNGLDINSMRMMLRALLVDRFNLMAHLEDRVVPGYALVADKPKLRAADPSNRPGCKNGPGADGKDPRAANPLASRLVTCRNMTLAQFAEALSKLTSEENPILFNFPPVVDATGVRGQYDLTINFTPPPVIRGDTFAPEPDGTITIFDALKKQLGLKLEARQVLARVLVIDHVDEKPTEN